MSSGSLCVLCFFVGELKSYIRAWYEENQNVAAWSFCVFVIFVANLRVPVNRSEGSTKTHKFAAKVTNICDGFSENLCVL